MFKIMSRSPEMFAARIALLAASTVFLVNACTNGTPQWDEATWDMFRVFGRLLEVATRYLTGNKVYKKHVIHSNITIYIYIHIIF